MTTLAHYGAPAHADPSGLWFHRLLGRILRRELFQPLAQSKHSVVQPRMIASVTRPIGTARNLRVLPGPAMWGARNRLLSAGQGRSTQDVISQGLSRHTRQLPFVLLVTGPIEISRSELPDHRHPRAFPAPHRWSAPCRLAFSGAAGSGSGRDCGDRPSPSRRIPPRSGR